MATIYLNKFGTVLSSRQNGREAFLAIGRVLDEIGPDDRVNVDFTGVSSFSPSWGGEFLLPLKERFEKRLFLVPSSNPSVVATLDILKRAHGVEFQAA
jgi:hypothetical protein